MAKITDSLIGSIKSKLPFSKGEKFSVTSPEKTIKEFEISTKIIAKNFMSLPGIARDLNVARQNVQQLVKVMGGKVATGADAQFLKAAEREKKLAVESAEERAKDEEFFKRKEAAKAKAPTQIITQEKIQEENKPASIFGKLEKYLKLGLLVTLFVTAFWDDIVAKVKEWSSGLWTTIKEKFDEFVQYMRDWFDEIVQPIVDSVKEVFNKVVEKVSGFFTSIGEWIAEKFTKIKEFFEPVVEFIKGVFDKFMVVVEKVKEGFELFKQKAKEIYEGLPDWGKKLVPDFISKFLGAEPLKKEEPKPVPVTPGYEEGAAIEEAISGIEIPREEAAPVVPKVAAPKPKPRPRPPKAKPKPPPAPSVTPTPAKPITAQPPTPTGKAAQVGGSLSSVVSTQSGVDLSGMHPEFQKRLTAMATAFKEETGKKLLVTSGYRSNEKQAELFNAKLAQLGGDRAATRKKVAEPMPPLGKGRGSFHLKGLAIDINSKGPAGINTLAGDRANPTGWLEKFGLTRPVKGENWHIQPIGTLPTADNPDNPGAPTLVAGKDGKPVDLASGKKESLGQPETQSTSASGGTIASASTDLAAGQRAQQKPQTPIVINSPKTTNTIVQNNIPAVIAKSKTDAGKTLMSRVT